MVMFPVHQVCPKPFCNVLRKGQVDKVTRQIKKKRWEDKLREMTGLKFGKSQRAVENREI